MNRLRRTRFLERFENIFIPLNCIGLSPADFIAPSEYSPMELAEVTRRKDADEQRPEAERKEVTCPPRIECVPATALG